MLLRKVRPPIAAGCVLGLTLGLLLAPRALQAGAAPAATPRPTATSTAKPSPTPTPRPAISLEHPDRVLMRHTHQVLEGLRR